MDKFLLIAAEPDNDTQIKIKHYEKIILENGFIGKQTKDIPYHISLCCYSLEYENYLKDLLDDIKKQFREFTISYNGFGLFNLNVLYLNPAMNLKLIELYNFIKDKSLFKEDDLSAHTTLLMDEPENILRVIPKLFEGSIKVNGKIKYISLYEFFPTRFIKRIELTE